MAWDWVSFPTINATNYVGMAQYSNLVTNYAFGPAISFTIFIIAFVAMKRWPTPSAIAFASYITFFLTIFLRIMSLVPDGLVWLWLIMTAVSTFLIKKDTTSE